MLAQLIAHCVRLIASSFTQNSCPLHSLTESRHLFPSLCLASSIHLTKMMYSIMDGARQKDVTLVLVLACIQACMHLS